MSRGVIFDDVTDTSGNALPSISVTIYEEGTFTKATLFDARTGGNNLDNPLTTNERGIFLAYLEPGSYDISVAAPTGTFVKPGVPALDPDDVNDLNENIDDINAALELLDDTGALNALQTVDTLAELKSIDTTGFDGTEKRLLAEKTSGSADGYPVIFRTGDQSANVATDTDDSWIAPSSPGDGSTGAWQRALVEIAPIDDSTTADDSVWSSEKTSSELASNAAASTTYADDEITNHNADAGAHPALSAFITSEADRAEAAADAATLNAGIYDDTTAGLAATSDGDYFSVPSAEDGELLILYLHDTGGVATEIGASPNSTVISGLNDHVFPPGYDLSPWNFALTVNGEVLIGEDANGGISKFDAPTHVLYEESVGGEGQVFSQNINTGDAIQLSTAGSNNSSPFVDRGHAVYTTDRDSTYVGSLVAAPLSGGREIAYIGRKRLACWGDSQTAGTGAGAGEDYPTVLGTLLGWPVYNGGVGSQTSYQIAARQGGVPATVEVVGEEIPASGSVTIDAISQDLLFNVGTGMTGTLAGVEGNLSRVSASEYTFTRSASGSVTPCPDGTPFMPSETDEYRDDLAIICMGRNDDAWAMEHIFALTGMLNHLTALNKRFILLGQMHGTTGNVVARSNVTRNWAAQYPDNFIDINTELHAYGDGSTGDNDDIADGLIPRSLRADTIPHLNADGYAALADIIHDFIITKGWA